MTLEHQTALQLRFAGQMHYESACHGKRKFPDMRSAKDGARAMHKKMHKQFSAYRCPYCDQFHIGGRRKDLEHRGDIENEAARFQQVRGYRSGRGKRQIVNLMTSLMRAKCGVEPVPHLELPDKNGELYHFLVIGPEHVMVGGREEHLGTSGIFVRCQCGEWVINDGPPCQSCLGNQRYVASFVLSVEGCRLLVNGVPLDEAVLP